MCGTSLFSQYSREGVLKLDNGTIVYDGSLVRGKMNGQGTITFQNGDQYTGGFNNGAFNGQGTFQSKEGWTYEGDFVNGQAEGKGKLITEQEDRFMKGPLNKASFNKNKEAGTK